MMKIFFSGRNDDNFIEENTTLNDKVIDLTKHGFYLSVDGLDLGSLTPKTQYIEIGGANGKIDVTNALTDNLFYENRNPKIKYTAVEMNAYEHIINRNVIENIFDGSKRKMYIDDWYLEGRFTATPTISKPLGSYEIDGDCFPYRMNIQEDIYAYDVADSLECIINYNDTLNVCPVINVSSNMTITLNEAVYSLFEGNNIVPDFIISKGENHFTLKGTGTAKITFRGGNL